MVSSATSQTPSFDRVYREQFEFVWRTLRGLGVRESAIDDAVQDVFIVVHRRLPEFEGRASMRTWTYEIARRVAMRYRSRSARHAARHCDLPALVAHENLDDALDQAKAAEVMQTFLWNLDEARRRAFVLSEFGELPGRQIAETLGVNINTIYARIRSARTELERLAKRMHAHDANAVRRAIRDRRPDASSKRRAWASLMAATAQDALVLVAPGLGFGTFACICAAVAAVGIAVSRPWTQPASRARELEPHAVVATALPAAPAVRPRPRVLSSPPTLPAVAPTTRAARPRSPVQAGATSLRDELHRVREIRDALHRGDHALAKAHIAEYRGRFARGALVSDVDALEVELGCKDHAADAQLRLDAFLAEHPSTTLRVRLQTACSAKIAPQRPSAPSTNTR
ncbi:MAG: RNA polymerase sigma factor [Nannocystaceae bacterium]|nr:sigma-70 family RNA polymerase sigma factor [bacterium]